MSDPAIFFELAGTLGAEWASAAGDRLAVFRRYRDVLGLLDRLAPQARLGVFELDAGVDRTRIERAIVGSGLGRFIQPAMVVQARPRDPDPFAPLLAAADLESDPDLAMFVSPDATRRLVAARRGLRVAPHPVLALASLTGDPLYHVRLEAPQRDPGFAWSALLEGLPVVPLHLDRGRGSVLIAIAAASALETLVGQVAVIERMGRPEDVSEGTLYLFRAPSASSPEAAAWSDFADSLQRQLPFVRPTDEGLLAVVPGDRLVDAFHPPRGGHGHTSVLLPRMSLLLSGPGGGPISSRALSLHEKSALSALDGTALKADHDAWVGNAPIPTAGGDVLLASRNLYHPGNAVAVSAIAARLAQICGAANVLRHKFPFVGATWDNVQADIPGATSELVVVGAHLDSTAASTPGYPGNEATAAAPGADDDASGIAAVLAAAEVLKALSAIAQPQRTIRFVLFNAEEQGIQGSPHYSSDLKSSGAAVVAMLQMDMIGWSATSYPPGIIEVHGTGSANDSPTIHAASAQLAQVVVDAAGEMTTSLQAQIHPEPGCSRDPASGRSDHSAFHAEGWTACLVCEDLFAGPCDDTLQTGNPAYHTQGDLGVDFPFAADVARAVAAAAWMIAAPTVGAIVGTDTYETPAAPGPPGVPVILAPGPPPDEPPAAPGPEPTTGLEPGPLQGEEPMPKKYLVEFLAKWIRDEDFRCKVLHKEMTTLEDWELTTPQILDLLSLDKDRIVKRLVKELEEDLGIDLTKAQQEVYAPGQGGSLLQPQPVYSTAASAATSAANVAGVIAPRSTIPGSVIPDVVRAVREQPVVVRQMVALMSANTAYNEGKVHVRGVTPTVVANQDETLIVIRGQGFDTGAKVEFRQAEKTVAGSVLGISCDVDVFQRVTVKVTLDGLGDWSVHGKNDGEEWSTEDVTVTVT